jgi:hypothetical protein
MCIEQQRQMLEEMRGIRKALEYLVRQGSPTTVRIINKAPFRAYRPVLDLDDAARDDPYASPDYVLSGGFPTGEPPEDSFLDDEPSDPYPVELDRTW